MDEQTEFGNPLFILEKDRRIVWRKILFWVIGWALAFPALECYLVLKQKSHPFYIPFWIEISSILYGFLNTWASESPGFTKIIFYENSLVIERIIRTLRTIRYDEISEIRSKDKPGKGGSPMLLFVLKQSREKTSKLTVEHKFEKPELATVFTLLIEKGIDIYTHYLD